MFIGDVAVCIEGLVACPQPDGSIRCVQDTIGCGKSSLSFLVFLDQNLFWFDSTDIWALNLIEDINFHEHVNA